MISAETESLHSTKLSDFLVSLGWIFPSKAFHLQLFLYPFLSLTDHKEAGNLVFLATMNSLQDPGSPTSYGILPLGHQATPGLSSKEGGPCSPVVCHTGEGRGGAEHPGDWKELN